MANAEWQQLQAALRQAPTPEARKAAAEAMRRYLAAHPLRSRPTLVSLKYKAPYPSAIELKDVPEELERNPEFYLLLSRIIGGK